MTVKKLLSLLTLGCFLFSSVFAETIHASLPAIKSAQAVEEAVVSQQAGRITDAHFVNGAEQGGTVVVTIQDLHCHPEVQRNIAKILSELDKQFSLKKVYVEGGYGDVDTSWLCNIQDKQLKKEITENLVDQGKLTGSEYYSVLSDRPDLLKGIEDEALHKANVVRLGKLLERKPRYEKALKLFDRDLAFMEAKYFSRGNREFNRLVEKYKKGGIPADKYYTLLGKYVKTINAAPEKYSNVFAIDRDNYRNMTTYLELAAAGKRLNYKKVSHQMQQFVRLLKMQLPYSVYNSLLTKTGNFSKTDELYLLCAGLAKEYHLDLAAFPDLQRFFDYVEKSRNVNPVQLLSEEKRLVEEIRTGLSENMTEAEVSFLADFYMYFRDYLLNRLQADDYAYFSERFEKFKHTWSKYAFEDRFSGLNADFDLLNGFYAANCKRNEYFLDGISELCAVNSTATASPEAGGRCSGLRDLLAGSRLIVIVTGGFHTDGLKTLLRDRGISCLTITPAITTDAQPAGDTYVRLAKHQAELLSNALQLGLASQALTDEKFRFYIEAANRELRGINFTEKNFNALMEKLKEVVGDAHIAATAFDDNAGRATVTFGNGRTITLTRDAGRDSFKAAVDGFNRLMVASTEEAVRQTAAVLNAEIVTADALIGFVELIYGTGSAYLNIMKFAAEHGLVTGDGYIYELKEDPKLLDLVNRELQGIAALLPVPAQETALERVERKLRLEETGRANRRYEVLLAIDLVRDFLVATDSIPPNAAFGDRNYANAEINQAVAAGLANNTLSIDRELAFYVEGALTGFFPYMFSQNPDFSRDSQKAYQHLQRNLKGKHFSVALTGLLEQVTLLPVVTEEGLFEYKGKKFAAAHSGSGGEAADRNERNIYYAVKKDGTSLFTPDELLVIIAHELIHLVFMEYGIAAWYAHDLATDVHQMFSEYLFGTPGYVDEKFRQIRNGIIQRRPPGSAIPDKYFEGDDNEVAHFNDDAPYDMDDEIGKLAQLSGAKAAGLDITKAVEEFGREVLNDANLSEDKRQLFFAFLGLYFSDNDADVTKSIKLLPRLLMGTGYSLVGNPKTHDFIIGRDTQRLEIRTTDLSNVYVDIHDVFMKAVNHGLPGSVIDENGFIHMFFEDIDESYLMQVVGRSLAERIGNAGERKSDRLAQLSALLNPRYNGRYLAEMIADAGTPDNGEDNGNAVRENLEALYKARTGREMSALDIVAIEDALRGLKPSQITELAEKVIATGAFFEYQEHSARFIENVESTTRIIRALGTEYLQIRKKDVSLVTPESLGKPQYAVLEKEAYVQALAAIRERRDYDARELMKEIVLAHYENRYEDAERTIRKLNIDNLFDGKARVATLSRLKLKDAEIPLSLGYSFAALIEGIDTASATSENGEIGFRQSPDAAVPDDGDDLEDYETDGYGGAADQAMPFDELFRTIEALYRLKTGGTDIAGKIEKLRDVLQSDPTLPAGRKSGINKFLDLHFSDEGDARPGIVKLLKDILQGTGYVMLGVPKLGVFIVGRFLFPARIGTADLGEVDLFIYGTLLTSGRQTTPRGMIDENGAVHVFTSAMNEGLLIHETAHSLERKIGAEGSKRMSERLAYLSALLNTHDNGAELARVLQKVRTVGRSKRIAHHEARENILQALYEVKTGKTMPVFDIDAVEDALRGLRPSEIAALAEQAIYEGGFFSGRKKTELFIRNIEYAIQDIVTKMPLIRFIVSTAGPGILKSEVNATYLQGLEAIVTNSRKDAVKLIKKVVYEYYDRSGDGTGAAEKLLKQLDVNSVFNGKKRKIFLEKLQDRNMPMELGYLLAALIESIETNMWGTGKSADASAAAGAEKAAESVKSAVNLGILLPVEEISEGISGRVLEKLEDRTFFASWLDSKERRDARLKQLILEDKVIDFSSDGEPVQLTMEWEDERAAETPADEKYRRLHQERVKEIYGLLDEVRQGKGPEGITAYLEKRSRKNGLTTEERALLLEKITDPLLRIRMVKDAYFVDVDPLLHVNLISHAGLGEHEQYGPQRVWLPEQAIRILSAEEIVQLMIEEGLHMIRPAGKHGVNIFHDKAFLEDVAARIRRAQFASGEIRQSPGISAIELLTLLSEEIGSSLDAFIENDETKNKGELLRNNSLVVSLLELFNDPSVHEELIKEITGLMNGYYIPVNENGDIPLVPTVKALIADDGLHIVKIDTKDNDNISLIFADKLPYTTYIRINLQREPGTHVWVAASPVQRRLEQSEDASFSEEDLNRFVDTTFSSEDRIGPDEIGDQSVSIYDVIRETLPSEHAEAVNAIPKQKFLGRITGNYKSNIWRIIHEHNLDNDNVVLLHDHEFFHKQLGRQYTYSDDMFDGYQIGVAVPLFGESFVPVDTTFKDAHIKYEMDFPNFDPGTIIELYVDRYPDDRYRPVVKVVFPSKKLKVSVIDDAHDGQMPIYPAGHAKGKLSVRVGVPETLNNLKRRELNLLMSNSLVQAVALHFPERVRQQILKEIEKLLSERNSAVNEKGEIPFKVMVRALIEDEGFHVVDIEFPEKDTVTLSFADGEKYSTFLKVTLQKEPADGASWLFSSVETRFDVHGRNATPAWKLLELVDRIIPDEDVIGPNKGPRETFIGEISSDHKTNIWRKIYELGLSDGNIVLLPDDVHATAPLEKQYEYSSNMFANYQKEVAVPLHGESLLPEMVTPERPFMKYQSGFPNFAPGTSVKLYVDHYPDGRKVVKVVFPEKKHRESPDAAVAYDYTGDRQAVGHIVRYAALNAALKKAQQGDVFYSEMDKAEKDRVTPAGFKVSIAIRNEKTEATVYSRESGELRFYFMDLKEIEDKDRDDALRQGTAQIEKMVDRGSGRETADTAAQSKKVMIDYSLSDRKVRYNENGTPVASPYYLGKAGHLRKIKKGESWAFNQTMLTYLDDVGTIDEFKKTVKAATSVGNGLMAIKPEVIEDIGTIYDDYEAKGRKKITDNYNNDRNEFIMQKTAQIARYARSKGNELFISLLESDTPAKLTSMKERYKDTGVAGYIYWENNRMAAYHFATGDITYIAPIRDYNNPKMLSDLIEAASKSPEAVYKMVYASDLKKLIRGEGEARIRAIDEKKALFDLLKPFLITLYDPSKQLTTDFVEDVAFGWDREDLPGIAAAEFQDVVDTIENGKSSTDDILAKMGLGEGVSHPVRTYVLDKLAGDVQGPEKEKNLEQLQKTFLTALFREVLVKEKMQGAVLADPELRDMLGRKLYQRLKEKITGTEIEIFAREFVQRNNVSVTEFYMRLNAKLRELNTTAGPQAINTIIELAPLGDREVRIKTKRESTFSADAIDAILSAA